LPYRYVVILHVTVVEPAVRPYGEGSSDLGVVRFRQAARQVGQVARHSDRFQKRIIFLIVTLDCLEVFGMLLQFLGLLDD